MSDILFGGLFDAWATIHNLLFGGKKRR